MKTLFQPMYRLTTSDGYIVSDWYYSQSECVADNEFNAFEIEQDLVEHLIIDNVPYPCDTIEDTQLFYLTYSDNEVSVQLKEN